MADQSEQEEKLEPLVIFYDSEASDGNVYYGDVIEIAATCHPGVVVGSFERLINTKQRLGSFAIQESGITEDLLQDKPFISEVIVEFLDWIDEMVVLAQKKNNTSYFPVLCAHGGYQFDFLILFANLERRGISHSKLSNSNIHFADSFLFCQQLQQDDTRCLQNTRLSIDGLFHNFFPRHTIKGRHRAMGDVKAMVKIFTQTPLKNLLHLMSVSTTLERVKYFVSQSSAKEQHQILEEKMSSLDACSRSMYSKRLLKGGLTYDLLKIVFQNCSSYMDFWQTLKKIGIERKVAKHFTSQFSAMGLENQGSLGFVLNAAMQNGSLSNGSSRDSNGHSDRGNLVSSNDKSETSGPSRTSNSNRKTNSSRDKGVIGTMPAERATSSSRAFEERPLDYAVTSSADERPKAYAIPRSAKQLDNKKDASENPRVASDIKQSSCPGVEPTTTNSVSSENGNSRDLAVCNGDENWDSEIESSVRRGHFVLQFSEVIPSSIVQEDVCSSSEGSSAVQHRDAMESYSKRAPTHPDRNQEKRNVGKKKELVSHSKRNDDRLSIGQGKIHEHSHATKSGKSSLGFDKSNKNTDKQDTSVTSVHDNMSVKEITGTRLDKSQASAVSSENGKQGTTISSARKEETKQVNLNKSAGNMPKVTDATNSKTLKSSMEEVAPKELDLESVKTKRKASSKKKPSSVTFVEPVDVPPVDPSTDVSTGNVHMTTVYVGDVPILVPVKKHSAPCQDDLDQPAYENKEQVEVTGNRKNSTDETTMSRKEGDTLNKESPISFPTVAEGMSLSKESEDGHSVSRQVENGQSQKMDDSEESKTSASDALKPTSTMESFSSSAYETSDTGSNVDYNNEPGSAPVNHCPSGDISNAHDFRKQVSPTIEQVNQPTAHIIEENPSCDMENASNIEQESENLCNESENQGDILVDNSGEVDISPDMATQEQMNGYPEGPWASSDVVCPNHNMYPMPPPQYPFQMPYPTAMPSVYGFYPRLPHMMPVIPGPRPVPYPTMPFASQGMIPFGGFPPRIHMPMPMFQPAVYPPAQDGPPLNLNMSEQDAMPQTSRSSPEVLGIPGNRIQTSEHQNNKTPGISNVSFSTSSDEHSARSSPFPVDDSSGKTTPLTTPHRSPVDEFSPGALSSSDKGEQGYHGRKGYRKETRPARYHTDERSRRPNRNVPWKENNYRDKVNKKYLPEKASWGDLVDHYESKSREIDGAQDERKKTKESDNPFKKDKHSSGHAKESSDPDKKLDSSSPKRSSKPPQSEQVTPPRREAKSGHGTWKHSPKTPKSARFDLASPRSSPTKSRGEQLTPPRTGEKDHSPKTLHRDTRNERSQQEPGEERNSSDYKPSQQTTPTFSKANQGSSIKSSQNESHKSEKSDGINKRVAKDLLETQKSSRASNVRAPPRIHPSGDGDPHSTTSKSSSKSSARASSISDEKHDKFISSEKEPKQWNQEDESTVTPRSLNKERKRYPSKSHITDSESVKWPQSALASQKFNDPPKPQRDLSSRTRRARESYSSGSERDKRVESNRRGVVSRRNEDVKEQSKAARPTTDEKKTTDSIPASGNVTSKEPFSASGNDLKKKSHETTQKNARESQKSVDYRDVLLEKQETRAHENANYSSRTNRILSSDRVKDESTGSVEPKTLPEAANTAPTKEPLPESGPMKKPRGTPHSGDQEKTVGKECRSERENTTKQHSKETRGGNTTRGSGMSREPTPRNSTRNAPRNRQYHSNNNNNIQSRNKANKS